jgi:hypothetical protein
MDASTTLITPELMHELGALAFDQGRSQDEHYMNPGAKAIKYWQAGWHAQRIAHERKSNPLYPQGMQRDVGRAKP